MARKPITVRLNDEEAELLEQAARIDAVSQNEFVAQAVLDRIAAPKADPAFQAAVRARGPAGDRQPEPLAVLAASHRRPARRPQRRAPPPGPRPTPAPPPAH